MKDYINKILILRIVFLIAFLVVNAEIRAEGDNYIIKKGDVLTVTVMGHPEFSLESINVLPDGYVQFPGLGSVQAAGMSVKDFTKLVTESIGKYVLNPIVTVFISVLPSQIINVIGFVNRPGQIPIFEKISVMDAISRAGGIKMIKKCKKIVIIRADQTYEEILVKNLYAKDVQKRTNKLLDIGDTVYIVEPKEVNWSQLSFFTTLGYIIVSFINIF